MPSIPRLLALGALLSLLAACGHGHDHDHDHDGTAEHSHGDEAAHSHDGEGDHDATAEHGHDGEAPHSHDGEATHDHGHEEAATHSHDGDEHHHSHGEASNLVAGLRLNGEQRWRMDDHTRGHLARMAETCHGANSTTAEGLAAAAGDLDRLLDELIAGCTMTGEPHNQLHALLAQLIPTVQQLAESTDLEGGQATLEKITTLLGEADRFFE